MQKASWYHVQSFGSRWKTKTRTKTVIKPDVVQFIFWMGFVRRSISADSVTFQRCTVVCKIDHRHHRVAKLTKTKLEIKNSQIIWPKGRLRDSRSGIIKRMSSVTIFFASSCSARNDECEISLKALFRAWYARKRKGDQTFQSSLCRWQYNSRKTLAVPLVDDDAGEGRNKSICFWWRNLWN